MANRFEIDGYIGSKVRRDSVVVARIVHKESFFSKQKQDWDHREQWHSVTFFGRTADAFERGTRIGDLVVIWGGLDEYPRNQPGSQTRLHGTEFKRCQHLERIPADDDDPSEIYDSDSSDPDGSEDG